MAKQKVPVEVKAVRWWESETMLMLLVVMTLIAITVAVALVCSGGFVALTAPLIAFAGDAIGTLLATVFLAVDIVGVAMALVALGEKVSEWVNSDSVDDKTDLQPNVSTKTLLGCFGLSSKNSQATNTPDSPVIVVQNAGLLDRMRGFFFPSKVRSSSIPLDVALIDDPNRPEMI